MILAQTQKIILNTTRSINAIDASSFRAPTTDHDDEAAEEQIIMKLTTAGSEERDQLLEELMEIRIRPGGQRGRPRERGAGRRDPSRTPSRAGVGSERGPRRCPTARARMPP